MEEPSVLDYVKSRLFPWKYPHLEIPPEPAAAQDGSVAPGTAASIIAPARQEQASAPEGPVASAVVKPQPEPAPAAPPAHWPWRSLLALALALAAQSSLAPRPVRTWTSGAILLLAAFACLVWAYLRKEWLPWLTSQHDDRSETLSDVDPPTIHLPYLITGALLTVVAFISFSGLLFTWLNLGLVLLALFFTARAFWHPDPQAQSLSQRLTDLVERIRRPKPIQISASLLLALGAVAIVAFFRFYRIAQVPPEMNSDHAEKILDVLRVLSGQTLIFFPTNGGREAWQFYLVAALHRTLHIPLGFTILKLVTASVGFLALPFIYLLGKEIGNRRVGLLAFLFAGIAYWPNVVARAGMRLPFYILFTASTMYFLLRGLRTGRRNDFIWTGISLGLGFYGYSADRILPLVILLALGLFLLHQRGREQRLFVALSTLALIFVSLVLFIPLLRYILAEPDSFLFRTLTRMGSMERPIEGSVALIFLNNAWNALKMFSWSDGVVWVISIPDYPALGTVAGGLFYLGAGLCLLRYLHKRDWINIFLLISIPVLMLPSILALAFPGENPNLYRTGGALVPVFLMVALSLDGLMHALETGLPGLMGKRFAWGLALVLFLWSSLQDYDLVFNKYFHQYQTSAWNSSEMGKVARDYIETLGSPDTIWVVGFPHWVDTRLVALNAGYPGQDFQVLFEDLESTRERTGLKLFIVKPDDEQTIQTLPILYPQGWFRTYQSQVETKDFLLYFVPPARP
ncbi:MAG: glycosyltransferase family 39 protein [Chloroflexota bacterium]